MAQMVLNLREAHQNLKAEQNAGIATLSGIESMPRAPKRPRLFGMGKRGFDGDDIDPPKPSQTLGGNDLWDLRIHPASPITCVVPMKPMERQPSRSSAGSYERTNSVSHDLPAPRDVDMRWEEQSGIPSTSPIV